MWGVFVTQNTLVVINKGPAPGGGGPPLFSPRGNCVGVFFFFPPGEKKGGGAPPPPKKCFWGEARPSPFGKKGGEGFFFSPFGGPIFFPPPLEPFPTPPLFFFPPPQICPGCSPGGGVFFWARGVQESGEQAGVLPKPAGLPDPVPEFPTTTRGNMVVKQQPPG